MLKTTNYEVKQNGVVTEVIPEAYGIIRRLVVGENDMAVTYIGVYRSKDLARNHREVPPIVEKRIDFKSDRNANDRETAYGIAKTKLVERKFNHETKTVDEVIVDDRFFGWEDEE
jgi:hypothetical protein